MSDGGGKVDDLIIFGHKQGLIDRDWANKCALNNLTEL